MKNALDSRQAPAFLAASFCLLGVVAARYLSLAENALWYGFLGVYFLLVTCFLIGSSLRVQTIGALLLCCFLGAEKFMVDSAQGHSLPAEHLTGNVVVRGTVAWEPEMRARRVRFLMHAESLDCAGRVFTFPATVAVTVLLREDGLVLPLRYGASILASGMLDRPPNEHNPGEMSPRAYAEANGITHTLRVKGEGAIAIVDSGSVSSLMGLVVLPARRWILKVFDETVGGEEGEFLKGLVIGERGGLPSDLKEAFVNAGVAHVLAVSGSNVAVVASVLALLLQLLRLPRVVRTVGILAGLVGYMLVTGSQPPVVRATVTAGVMFVGTMIQRKGNTYNSLGVAVLLILAVDSRQAFDVGFQLSFAAVFSIIHFYPVTNSWISRLPENIWWQRMATTLLRVTSVSCVATLGTLPLTAVWFGRVSIIGLLANTVVIPATGLSVLLGAASVLGSLVHRWLASMYGAVNHLVLHWTLVLTRLAGNSSVAYIDTFQFIWIDALPFYLLLFLAFHWGSTGRFLRSVTLLTAANLLVFGHHPPLPSTEGRFRVTFIDVGQGDAALFECPEGYHILVDGGPLSDQDDAGKRVVLPFLKRLGVRRLDLVVISHPHADHAGGIPAILREIPATRVVAQRPSMIRAAMREFGGGPEFPCDSLLPGRRIDGLPDLRIYVLYPLAGKTGPPSSGNESAVVKIQYGRTSFLMTGDAELQEERELVGHYGTFLHSSVLKVGHHGSSTSSSQEFLHCIHPAIAVVSVGKFNRFRHPSAAVMKSIGGEGTRILRTDESGAVMMTSDGTTVHVMEWR